MPRVSRSISRFVPNFRIPIQQAPTVNLLECPSEEVMLEDILMEMDNDDKPNEGDEDNGFEVESEVE